MIIKQSISLLALSALLTSLGGVASAGEIKVQTPSMSATVSENGSIRVESKPNSVIVVPANRMPSISRHQIGSVHRPSPRNLTIPNRCHESRHTQQNTRTYGSGSNTTYSHSSVSTTACR